MFRKSQGISLGRSLLLTQVSDTDAKRCCLIISSDTLKEQLKFVRSKNLETKASAQDKRPPF